MKKVGLTLGGGGARGFAHIGVYKAFQQHKIPISYISGCSMGAIIGVGIAQGKSPDDLLKIVKEFVGHNPVSLKNLNLTHGSIFDADEILVSMKKLIPEKLDFRELKIPLSVNAVDIESGEHVVFDSGNVLEAVLASSAIPGIYPPVYFNERLFVDGGVLNSLPVDVCRGMGSEVIVAIDLKSYVSQQNISALVYHFYVQKDKEKGLHLNLKKDYLKELKLKISFPINIMMRAMAISERRLAERTLAKISPEFVIHPDVSAYGLLDFEDYDKIFEEGYRVGMEKVEEIKREIGMDNFM